jgi:hypothetical protein
MTDYGTIANVIGMYKDSWTAYNSPESEHSHTIVAISDTNKYLKIKLECRYFTENFGRYGIMYASYGTLDIEIDDSYIIKDITHFPINKYCIDLESIVNCNNEFKCDLFEISKCGDPEKYRVDDNFSLPRGEYIFNENLFNDKIETYLNNLPEDTIRIDISDRELTYLPDLSRFKNLVHLICSHNKLTILPPLDVYKELYYLDCSDNQLTSLPILNEILGKLNCFNNPLISIPTSLPIFNKKIINLFCDDKIETYLDNLPEDIIEIDISNKGLTYLPDLSRFKNLLRLDCSSNKLTMLPPLNLCKNLVHLDCSFNELTILPPLNLNEKLYILDCSNNQLTSLPIFNEILDILDCCNNLLTSLPIFTEKITELYCDENL